MKITNDEFSILDHFNRIAGELADVIKHSRSNAKNFEFEMDVAIPDIDDFWGIIIDDKDILTRHIEYVTSMSDDARQKYLDYAESILKAFPDFHAHYKAKIDRTTEPMAEQLRYLPHFLKYLSPVFEQLDGYNALKNALKEKDMKVDVFLTPRENIPQEEQHLHGWRAYCFVLVISETAPLLERTKAPEFRLN